MRTRQQWYGVLILVGLMTVWVQIAAAVVATGGAVSEANGYRMHVFTNSGTLTVSADGNAEVLVVAGGGGGGASRGGGGGAGGLVYASNYVLRVGVKTITVGNGGAGGVSTNLPGTNGEDSVFDVSGGTGATIRALGGGGGGSWNAYSASGFPAHGTNGGSGGGGSCYWYTTTKQGTKGSALQGNPGFSKADVAGYGNAGGSPASASQYGGGGGGGAGGVGTNGTTTLAGNGGAGVQVSSFAGLVPNSPDGWFAGGGGAGALGGTAGTGGLGGGGNGKTGSVVNGDNGLANTGGGGGGGADSGVSAETGGSGGSGLVIVRYLLNAASMTIGPGQDNQVSFGAAGGTLATNVQGNGGTNTTVTVRGQNTGVNSSKAWVKFDLTGFNYNANTSATVVVTATVSNNWGSSLRLYALTNGFVPGVGVLGTDWTEGGITWSNAPGNAGSAGNSGLICDPATTALIGSTNPATALSGDKFAFTIPTLGSFLQANTSLTVMLVFSPQNNGTTFVSKEHATLAGPKLTFSLKDAPTYGTTFIIR